MKSLGLLIVMIMVSLLVVAQEERSAPNPPPMIAPTEAQPYIEAEIVDFPEVDASFPGGNEAMRNWIDENLQYPNESRKLGDQGRIYVTFVVEADGSITNVGVRSGLTTEMNNEAIRLVQSMPEWKPAQSKGKNVRAHYRLPVSFVLD